MVSSDLKLTLMSLIMGTVGALLVGGLGWFYFRRVRIERPAIGTFNGRDVAVLFFLLTSLPVLYLHLPRWLMTSLLAVTFIAALSIGLRPLLSPTAVWLVVGAAVGANIWMGNNLLGTVLGWQAFWLENSIIVLFGAVGVANLYVQGGMKLLHVAWFAGALAIYDVIFTEVWPLTTQLVQSFLGYPLDPSMGMRVGLDNTAVGLGDLLVYGLFTIAALKAYGLRAARFALTLVVVFGALVPALVPLIINFIDPATNDILVPAQAWFGPAAVIGYRRLRRKYGRERTTREFLDSSDFLGRRSVPALPAPVVAAPVLEPVPAHGPATGAAAGTATAAVGGMAADQPVPAGRPAPAGQPVLDNATS